MNNNCFNLSDKSLQEDYEDLVFRKIMSIHLEEESKQILEENRNLLDLIAKHLIEVETLTREDIEDLLTTGQLTWWEKKKAKMAQEEQELKERLEKEQQEQEANTSNPEDDNK